MTCSLRKLYISVPSLNSALQTIFPVTFAFNRYLTKPNTNVKMVLSKDEAKKIIVDQTKSWGTDEQAVWNAIRKCNNRRGLMADAEVLNALKAEMEGHELWKCYLLLEYGSESNYPKSINELWKATSGAGTDEKGVFNALSNMTREEKKSFGLSYILHWELSGKDLEKAMNLIVTQDWIQRPGHHGSLSTGAPA